jgi:hypothetical protein
MKNNTFASKTRDRSSEHALTELFEARLDAVQVVLLTLSPGDSTLMLAKNLHQGLICS